MGMMIRRNIKKRAVKKAAPSNLEPILEKAEEITEEKKTYKKSDIFRMTTAELQSLAESEGIENATELTGSELKTILVKHFNL